MPALYRHFKDSGMMLEPVTCSWFMCLYINTLPLSIVLRVWDCLLWEGNVVLLRIGLAICKIQVRYPYGAYMHVALNRPAGGEAVQRHGLCVYI
jgi:hypothetical protein